MVPCLTSGWVLPPATRPRARRRFGRFLEPGAGRHRGARSGARRPGWRAGAAEVEWRWLAVSASSRAQSPHLCLLGMPATDRALRSGAEPAQTRRVPSGIRRASGLGGRSTDKIADVIPLGHKWRKPGLWAKGGASSLDHLPTPPGAPPLYSPSPPDAARTDGSAPTGRAMVALAQPAEQRTVDPQVTGSTPVGHPTPPS